jgi:hypothetical protein
MKKTGQISTLFLALTLFSAKVYAVECVINMYDIEDKVVETFKSNAGSNREACESAWKACIDKLEKKTAEFICDLDNNFDQEEDQLPEVPQDPEPKQGPEQDQEG